MKNKKKTAAAGKKNNKQVLVVVESPAKATTIGRYLGKGYSVKASMGHLVDLPKSRLAIDVDNDFEQEYITVRGRAAIMRELQSEAKKSTGVFLASDNDREGEAISYHIFNALRQKNPHLTIERIVFNEITPAAIKAAVAKPAAIDLAKVSAQKARRVVDRLVGYSLSPILWQKIKNGLSAGRVQSVALRLICEREAEVEAFVPEEYWSLQAELRKQRKSFKAQLISYKSEEPRLKNRLQTEELAATIKDLPAKVSARRDSRKKISPRPPFITSTLQQTASNRLGFTPRKTMQVAQQLYEGVSIGRSRVGLITYMRTDSVRISQQARDDAENYINAHFPEQLPEKPPVYTAAKQSQDAHEAIRPTYCQNSPQEIGKYLDKDQLKLYSIIWERFLASQMRAAETVSISYDFAIGEAVFRAVSTSYRQQGFNVVYNLLKNKDKQVVLPELTVGEELNVKELVLDQHFTSGPSRFSEAAIIKALEERRIGRPSTYAPTISVLLDRYYVVRKSKQLVPTQLGKIINRLLVEQFAAIINVDFTATMEQQLDMVESSDIDWVKLVREFYQPFKKQVDHVTATMESIKGVLDEPTDDICEKCGKPMVKKLGRFGFFLACSGFPACMNSKPVPLADCPVDGCNGKIISRRQQKGKRKEFYGCSNYPECTFISHFKPTENKCPKCGYFLVQKRDKKHGEYKACINDNCNYLHTDDNVDGEKSDE